MWLLLGGQCCPQFIEFSSWSFPGVLFKAPTVLTDVLESDPAMQQEIRGPVLPIMTVYSADEAINYIRRKEKPLCLYVFSSDRKVVLTLMLG